MHSSRSKYLFVVAAFVFGFICNSAFADSGCIGNGTVTSDPTNMRDSQVLNTLVQSFNGAKGTVPMPYRYAVGNSITGKYAVYSISAQYVQSSTGAVKTTPIVDLVNSGTTKSGLPPAISGCPKVDPKGSDGSGSGGSGDASGGGQVGNNGGGSMSGGWGASCSVARVTVGDQVRTEIVCP